MTSTLRKSRYSVRYRVLPTNNSTITLPTNHFELLCQPNPDKRQPGKMGKRKLDDNDAPAVAPLTTPDASASAPSDDNNTITTSLGFSDLGLDSRLLQAVAHQKYQAPTLVQSKVVPLALNGQDVLAKAKTGSGKTAAYLLPLLHNILKRKQVCFVSFLHFAHIATKRIIRFDPPQMCLS